MLSLQYPCKATQRNATQRNATHVNTPATVIILIYKHRSNSGKHTGPCWGGCDAAAFAATKGHGQYPRPKPRAPNEKGTQRTKHKIRPTSRRNSRREVTSNIPSKIAENKKDQEIYRKHDKKKPSASRNKMRKLARISAQKRGKK